MIRCIAFDCFGTLFDVRTLPEGYVGNYVDHVYQNDFSPYSFPEEWYQLKAHPGVTDGMKALQEQGIKVVSLSNGGPDLISKLAEAAGFTFDHIVDLAAHKVYKPHLGAYTTVWADTGIAIDDTLMVTANPTFGDLSGAFAVGMTPVLLRQLGWPQTVFELSEWVRRRTMNEFRSSVAHYK